MLRVTWRAGVRVVRLTYLGRCLRRFRHPTPRPGGTRGEAHVAPCQASRNVWGPRTQQEAFLALHAAAVRNHNACAWGTAAFDEVRTRLIACSMERLARPCTHNQARRSRVGAPAMQTRPGGPEGPSQHRHERDTTPGSASFAALLWLRAL